MIDSLLVLIAGVGLSHLIVDGRIFQPLREWLGWPMLNCFQCTGFWAGLVAGLLGDPWHCLLYAFAVSYLAMPAKTAMNMMMAPK